MQTKPKNVEEYIASAPKESRAKLKEMQRIIKTTAKGAEGTLKWSMPAYSYKRILVTFAGYKHHIGFYPTPRAITKFKKEISKYKTAKGSVQFPLDKPLPLGLIKKITAFRVKEALEEDKKWKN